MKKTSIKILQFLGIESLVKSKICFLLYLLQLFFIKIGLLKDINCKSISIIVISFNQLYYLKQLVDFLKSNNYQNIIIIDNNSTYEPLLNYFKTIESSVTIHRLNENLGHLVFWKKKELFDKYSKGYYVVTDADIIPVQQCPEDFVFYFKKILDENYNIVKAGFSLKIDDIPNENLNKQKVIDWESQFWLNPNYDQNFISEIDTTFALYRPYYNYLYDKKGFYDAIRTKFPYQAIHGGWYLDSENLTEEQLFYFQVCNSSSSWRINEKGEVQNQNYMTKC